MSKKLENRVAVITGATSGMALATAKLFVEEGAYVFVMGRSQEKLDKAVKEIGRNVTGVQAMPAFSPTSIGCSRQSKMRKAISTSSLLVQVLASSATRLALLPRKALMRRLTSTFEGLCLQCKRPCRS